MHGDSVGLVQVSWSRLMWRSPWIMSLDCLQDPVNTSTVFSSVDYPNALSDKGC